MRTRQEIKKQITDAFISNSIIKSIYNLVINKTFEEQFSLVSLENILFDIISYAIFVHEQIVEKNAENSRPHTIRWYREQCTNFLDGLPLTWLNGQFQYDLTNVVDVNIRKIIDRCAVLESNNGELVIKIATDNNGVLQPITPQQFIRFKTYVRQIKDAGNRIRFINTDADNLKIDLTVYVDPLIIDLQTGQLLNTTETIYPVKDAINNYLADLEFNGAFVREYFRDSLQNAKGVKLPKINELQSQFLGFPFTNIIDWKIPNAGYFKIEDTDLIINYLANELD